MIFLAVVGAIAITAILLYLTLGFLYLFLVTSLFEGFDSIEWQGWIIFVAGLVVLGSFWTMWYFSIGIHIHLSFS